MSLPRYDIGSIYCDGYYKTPDGEWVKLDDVIALLEKIHCDSGFRNLDETLQDEILELL